MASGKRRFKKFQADNPGATIQDFFARTPIGLKGPNLQILQESQDLNRTAAILTGPPEVVARRKKLQDKGAAANFQRLQALDRELFSTFKKQKLRRGTFASLVGIRRSSGRSANVGRPTLLGGGGRLG